MLLRYSMAIALAASLAGVAQAHPRNDRGPEILPELPANAPPGECYARVKVPGEPQGPPPMMMGAQWVLNPGPPGSPGPIWCLVPTGPAPVAVAPAVERFGWIRVLCDDDATPERIRGVQERLHKRGYYHGKVSGRYDRATADAVGQFQSREHIGHGGYLSMQTLDALDDQDGYAPPPPGPVYGGGYESRSYQQSESYQESGGYAASSSYGYGYGAPVPSPCAQTCYTPAPPPPVYYQPPVYQPPVYQPPVYAPPPCGCIAPQAYYGGYNQGYYAGTPTPAYAAHSAIQNGWLTWGGKTRF